MTNPHRIILAVDDMPDRYVTLADRLRNHNLTLVCVQHPVAFEMLFKTNNVAVILLDHDMPTYSWDDQTNAVHLSDEYNGQYYARWIAEYACPLGYQIPVIITSANSDGARKISDILKNGREVHPARILSVLESCPEERWLGAILDAVYGVVNHALS